MTGFLRKIFGGGKKKSNTIAVVEGVLQGVVDRSGLQLSFEVKEGAASDEGENLTVEFFGEDEAMLTDREGQLLDAFQLFTTRVSQHKLPESKLHIEFDCQGFREENNRELLDLAEKLKETVIAKRKSVYFRALPPKERKIVHQYLADDDRVKSRSIGEGLYKKIKIYPAGQGRQQQRPANS